MPVALGADAHLDVETEQPQPTILGQAWGLQVVLVDLRLVQANATRSSEAGHGLRRLLSGALLLDQLVGDVQYTFRPPAVPRSKRYLPLTTMLGTPVISYFFASSLLWLTWPLMANELKVARNLSLSTP